VICTPRHLTLSITINLARELYVYDDFTHAWLSRPSHPETGWRFRGSDLIPNAFRMGIRTAEPRVLTTMSSGENELDADKWLTMPTKR
jgi:hypothetical protein